MLLALSAIAPLGAQQQCPTPSTDAAIATVRELNQRYIDAARDHNVKWFDAHLSSQFIVILGSGRRLTKPEFLKMLSEERADYKSLTVRNVTLRRFGATVQVDAEAPWEMWTERQASRAT